MSTRIERLRYYDGEYLRSFDFEAEQNYHLEMRRRLNMGLHLPGIVEGLEIQSRLESTVTTCWINPGMAVDAYGREIFVASSKTFDLDDDAFKSNRINPPGDFSVWLRFRKSATGAPSIGYSTCNEKGVTTRWQESFDVVLLLQGSPEERTYNNPPATPVAMGAMSEDAANDRVAVYLGTVSISADGDFAIPELKQKPPAAEMVTSTEADGARPYIGVRAQRIAPPVDARSSFNILTLNTAQNPATSVEVDGTFFAKENLIVGGDFDVAPKSIKAPASGNAKVTGDLYLRGAMYSLQNGNFVTLDAYIANAIKNFVPDIKTGTVPIVIGQIPKGTTATAAAASGSVTFQVNSALARISSFSFSASLAKVELDKSDAVSKILDPAKLIQGFSVEVSAKVAPSSGTAPVNPFDVTMFWSIAPTLQDPGNPANLLVPVKSLSVAYTIVFYPDTSTPAALP